MACQGSSEKTQANSEKTPWSFNNDSARQVLLNQYLERENPTKSLNGLEMESESALDFEKLVPIFKTYCSTCHGPNGNGPFPLDSYSQIKKRAKAIKEALQSRIMPPWRADNSYRIYHNDQSIPDSSRKQIIQWIDEGLKASEEGKKLSWDSGIRNQPDFYIGPTDTLIINTEKDIYQCNIIDPHFEKETYVSAITYLSTNPNLVHHYTLFADTTGNNKLNSETYDCKNNNPYKNLILIDSWTKGMRAIQYEKNIAYRFPKETIFVLQIHYSSYGNMGKSESTRLGLYTNELRPEFEVNWVVKDNRDLDIKANTISTESNIFEVKEDMILLGIMPHMHYLGKIMEIFAIKPNREKVNLLYIPDWSYVVQSKYYLEQTEFLPKGSLIYTNVVYDNTAENPEQPNHPVRDVIYDLSGYDEMLVSTFYYVEPSKKLKLPAKTVSFIE